MFYIVDKPRGVGSNLVAKILKRVLNVDKIGFLGTLDPEATGLMIIWTCGTSRLFPLMEERPKTYVATIQLDGTTDSYDLEQPITSLEIDKNIIASLSKKYIEDIISNHFVGEIEQVPPHYSAVWINGKRAYELARSWQEISIASKKRTIYSFEILSYSWPQITAKISVSSGTYIRSLARDLWNILATWWYLADLRRISIGSIYIDDDYCWIQHNDIRYAATSHEAIFPDITTLDLSEEDKQELFLGSNPISTNQKNGDYFVSYSEWSYGLLRAEDGKLFPLKNRV